MTNSHRIVLLLIASTLISSASRVGGASTLDNVAVQWNYLFNLVFCRSPGAIQEPNIVLAQLHLAQWHSLLALKRVTESEISQDLVVAYASHTVLANYFPYEQVTAIDPLLDAQLTALNATEEQQTLGKRLGEAVAISLLEKRRTGREFALRALKSALNAEGNDPRLGLWRYLNNTPAGRAAASFVFYGIPIARPYVVPEPRRFIKTYLASITPPMVPSSKWNKAYASIVEAGRSGNPNRTAEMNVTAAFAGCGKVEGNVACFPESIWSAITRSSLPPTLSLYDTVETFAKLAVTMHDAMVVLSTLQYGFWFWRPESAIRAGDPDHAPIPNWTPWLRTPPHPEYPSGTVTSYSAAATVPKSPYSHIAQYHQKMNPFLVHAGGMMFDEACMYISCYRDVYGELQMLESIFDEWKKQPNAIKVSGGGQFAANCPIAGAVPDVEFNSFADAVAFGQRARVWAGAHYEQSVVDAVQVGKEVAKYVQEYWEETTTPSGVMPDLTYLTVVAEFPKKQGAFTPIRATY